MTTELTTGDATAIATPLLAQLEQAWNDGDGTAFGAAFTDDADFVNVRGEHHVGVHAISAGHQGIFNSIYAGSVNRYELESAREVALGTIVAVANATLDVPTGPLQGVIHARLTTVLVDKGNRWMVAAFHNTVVQS